MALLFTGDSDALDKLTSHYGALERSYIFFELHCKNSLGYPVKLYCTRVTSILRTFDFFLKFLPLKDNELVMSEMPKIGVLPTSFWREHAQKNT